MERISPTSQIDFERYEAKYLIPPALVPEIREFIQPFCVPDPNASGPVPEYVLTTLQMDSPDLALYRAVLDEQMNRFKLRVRVYGEGPTPHVFMEIKRKIKNVVLKSRCRIPSSYWGAGLFAERRVGTPPFRSAQEQHHFTEFRRLVDQLGARPVMLIRYDRESYLSRDELYARVTFDRRLRYRPTRSWALPPGDGRWHAMDSAESLGRPFSGVILEMKTYRNTPTWMLDVAQRFNLEAVGFCKYAHALTQESKVYNVMNQGGWWNCTYSPDGIF